MKLYRTQADWIPVATSTPIWAGSQSEAASSRKKLLFEGFKRADIKTETVDIPTDKQGLLAWLNSNAV